MPVYRMQITTLPRWAVALVVFGLGALLLTVALLLTGFLLVLAPIVVGGVLLRRWFGRAPAPAAARAPDGGLIIETDYVRRDPPGRSERPVS